MLQTSVVSTAVNIDYRFQVPKGMLQTSSFTMPATVTNKFQVPKGMLQTQTLLKEAKEMKYEQLSFKSPRECYKRK